MPKFQELSKARISSERFAVVSKNDMGSYTLVQRIFAQDGQKRLSINMKGAFHLESLESLYNLRDALNEAIEKEEHSF